jgi:hypothetical protein
MNKKQLEELASIQSSIFDQVAVGDQAKLKEQFEVSLYWIRKQIWRRVQGMMLQHDDPVKAANFGTQDVRLPDNQVRHFFDCQATMITNQGEEGDEDIRRRSWIYFVHWAQQLINGEVSKRTNRYIKVSAKRKR